MGAEAKVQDHEGLDALMYGCLLHGRQPNHSEIAQLLLSHGADVSNTDRRSRSALHFSAKRGCLSTTKLLLACMTPKSEGYPDKDSQSFEEGEIQEQFIGTSGESFEASDIMDETPSIPLAEVQDHRGRTALMMASQRSHIGVVRILCSVGIDVKVKDNLGRTALHFAARCGCAEMVEVLLARGSEIDARDSQSLTALQIAMAQGHVEFAKELLARGADASSAESQLETIGKDSGDEKTNLEVMLNARPPLLLAAGNGHTEMVHIALSHMLSPPNFTNSETQPEVSPIGEKIISEVRRARQLAFLGCHEEVGRFLGFVRDLLESSGDVRKIRWINCCVCQKCGWFWKIDEVGANGSYTPSSNDSRERVQFVQRAMTPVKNGDFFLGRGNGLPEVDVHPLPRQFSNLTHRSSAASTVEKRNRPMTPRFKPELKAVLRRERHYAPSATFAAHDPKMKSDILRMIGMYLQEEGFTAATMALQDEAQISLERRNQMTDLAQRIHGLILRGEWSDVRDLANKGLLGRNYRRFLYFVYKEEFLELVSRGENERAFSSLHKKLKPLEDQSRSESAGNEFTDLCYLLTCKSVHDLPSFRLWDEKMCRQKLATDFKAMVTAEYSPDEGVLLAQQDFVPSDRLIHMLQQAVAYQLEFSTNVADAVTPKIETLLEDYEEILVPRMLTNTFVGHTSNVKCIEFLGRDGRLIASGSSDCTIMLWRVQQEENEVSDDEEDEEDPELFRNNSTLVPEAGGHLGITQHKQRGPDFKLAGHDSRVWDLASNNSGQYLVSTSADSTVRLWDVWYRMEQIATLGENGGGSPTEIETGHEGDIYTVRFQNDQEHIASGGYDKTVRLVNLRTNQLLKTLRGHHSAVTQVQFNPFGNLVVSASKDSTIRFWDTVSGVCVRTFLQHVGEITSVDVSSDGLQLLTSSKDSSVRLWDLRTGKVIERLRGYQNSSLNFVRAVFGPRDALVFSGSEDAKVHVWDKESGAILAKLRGHTGPVFHTKWSHAQGILATCSDDNTVRTWR